MQRNVKNGCLSRSG